MNKNSQINKQKYAQYFTPPHVAGFMLKMLKVLDPVFFYETVSILDPACGEGVFLQDALEQGITEPRECFGTDADPIMRECWLKNGLLEKMGNNLQIGDALANHHNTTFDLSAGNPPFGFIKINEENIDIFKQYDVFHAYLNEKKGRKTPSVFPIEVLFLEKFIKSARIGGLISVVIPEGILANIKMRYARRWIASIATPLAIISLESRVFQATGVSARTSLLFLRRENNRNLRWTENRTNVIMARAEDVDPGGKREDDLDLILQSSIFSLSKLIFHNIFKITPDFNLAGQRPKYRVFNRFNSFLENPEASEEAETASLSLSPHHNKLWCCSKKSIDALLSMHSKYHIHFHRNVYKGMLSEGGLRGEQKKSGIYTIDFKNMEYTRWDPDYHHPDYIKYFEIINKRGFSLTPLGKYMSPAQIFTAYKGPQCKAHTEDRIRYLTSKQITDIGIDHTRDNSFIDRGSPCDTKRTRIREGDLLLVRSGDGCIGRTVVAGREYAGSNIRSEIYILRPDTDILNPYYISVFLKCFKIPFKNRLVHFQIARLCSGVGTPNLNKEEILSIMIPSVSIEAQKKIEKEYREIQKIYHKAVMVKERLIIGKLTGNEILKDARYLDYYNEAYGRMRKVMGDVEGMEFS